MSSISVSTWEAQEKAQFDGLDTFLIIRLEDGLFRALAEKQHNDLTNGKTTSSVTLPWGTYTADVKSMGETGNITPTFEPSKAFKKLLNDDANAAAVEYQQEKFDEEYMKLFTDYVAYGYFYPDTVKDAPAKEKGLRLEPNEAEYFINPYLNVLVTIARDKERAGKTYRLEINEGYPHGAFDFVYGDGDSDDVTVKFIPDKAYKQRLKNDTLAAGDGPVLASAAYVALENMFARKQLRTRAVRKNPFDKLRRRH